MHRAKLLFDLQGIDLRIDAAATSLAQVEAQLGESPTIAEAHQALAERRRHQAERQSQLRALEWQADDLSAKITVEEAKLYGGSVRNLKELASLQEEVGQLKTRHRDVEDRALDLMVQLETLGQAIVDEASALTTEEAAWGEAQRRLQEEREQLLSLLGGLEEEHRSQVSQIAPADLEAYQTIREARGGRGAVRIEQGRCSGCRIGLSMADLQRARGHDLVRCSSCGRILYAG